MVGVALGHNGRSMMLTAHILEVEGTEMRQEVV